MAYAGFGELLDGDAIWKGALKPGAPMQVWKRAADFKKVVSGKSAANFDPFGHSFIFMGYVRNGEGRVTGLRIADQGYQSNRPLVPRDYEVWWAANLTR